jgi:hypothetical protein
MLTIRVGYRRVFLAWGVSSDGPGIDDLFVFDGSYLRLRVSKTLLHPVQQVEGSKYFVPTLEKRQLMRIKVGTDISYDWDTFTELYVWHATEFPSQIVDGINSSPVDVSSRDFLFDAIEARKNEFFSHLDLVQGIVGLKHSPQLFFEQLIEQPIVFGTDGRLSTQFFSPSFRLLPEIHPARHFSHLLRRMLDSVSTSHPTARRNASEILYWLQLAWRESSELLKFISLFVVIELIVEHIGREDDETAKRMEDTSSLHDLLTSSGMFEKLGYILDEWKGNQNLSLVQRFEKMARQYSLPSVDSDISAFRKFNRLRNRLMHDGFRNPSLAVELEQGQLVQFEALVERYVSLRLTESADTYRRHLFAPFN